jgi:hypothetical protein
VSSSQYAKKVLQSEITADSDRTQGGIQRDPIGGRLQRLPKENPGREFRETPEGEFGETPEGEPRGRIHRDSRDSR